jgi:hypothetical protein
MIASGTHDQPEDDDLGLISRGTDSSGAPA